MRTIRTKVYKFNELSKTAQERVIDLLSDININLDFVVEDADNIGLKITNYETDSATFVYNVRGEFNLTGEHTANEIIKQHGEDCETYKDAEKFLFELHKINSEEEGTQSDDAINDLEQEFLFTLLDDYKRLMQEDIEFQGSREQIIQTIEANEYEFTKDGNLFHS